MVTKIRLLYITRGFHPYKGGAENYISEIHKRLSKKHHISLITYYHKDRKKDERIYEVRQLKNAGKFSEFLNFFFSTLKNSLFLDFDIIHAVTYPSGLAAILPKLVSGKPLVVTIFDIGVAESGVGISPIVKNVKSFLQNIVCNVADAIIVPNKKVQHDIEKYFGVERKFFISPLGIEPFLFKGARTKSSCGKEPLILFLGMYSPKKGIDYLMHAVRELHGSGVNAKLVVVGPPLDRNYNKKIRELAAELGIEKDVRFAGFVEERVKIEWIDKADVCVFPSIYGEGFGLPIVECMARGRPVIATDIFERLGTVRKDTAIVVPTKDSEAISNSLMNLIKNESLYRRLGENGMKFAKKFDLDSCAEITEKVYEKVLKK